MHYAIIFKRLPDLTLTQPSDSGWVAPREKSPQPPPTHNTQHTTQRQPIHNTKIANHMLCLNVKSKSCVYKGFTYNISRGRWQTAAPHNHNSKLKTFQKQPRQKQKQKQDHASRNEFIEELKARKGVTCRVCVESGQHSTEDNTAKRQL